MIIKAAVVSYAGHMFVAGRLIARHVNLSQVELFALVPGFSLDELLGYVGPVTHPALHYSLHKSQRLLSGPVLREQGIL